VKFVAFRASTSTQRDDECERMVEEVCRIGRKDMRETGVGNERDADSGRNGEEGKGRQTKDDALVLPHRQFRDSGRERISAPGAKSNTASCCRHIFVTIHLRERGKKASEKEDDAALPPFSRWPSRRV
jgi:hypothetical protein